MDESLLLTSTVLKNLSSLSGLPVPLQWDLGQQGGSNIMNCLRAGLQSLSSDPRDKVFAVLSLMYPATRSLIPLDYGLDSATICSYCLTAIIIEQQSLHFATYIAGNSWNEELQSSCLDMNLFKLFVCNNRSRRWIPPTHTFKNISKHARKLWRSKISVQIVNILEQVVLPPTLDDSSYVLLYSSTCPPAVPDMISMPRMRTRSHFIDLIVDTPTYFDSHEGKPQIHDFCFSYGIDSTEPIKCFLWMRPFFRKSREDSADDGSHPDVFGEHDRYWQHRYPDVSLADMSSFLVGPNPASNMIITTRNTVGYTDTCKHVHTRNDFRQGDEVWAIDSLDIPLILRKLEDHVYRILGSCRLWAALELDYWNPGTKKGRWRDESLGPPEEQTRVIEIR